MALHRVLLDNHQQHLQGHKHLLHTKEVVVQHKVHIHLVEVLALLLDQQLLHQVEAVVEVVTLLQAEVVAEVAILHLVEVAAEAVVIQHLAEVVVVVLQEARQVVEEDNFIGVGNFV